MRACIVLLVLLATLVSGCGGAKPPPPRMVRVPDVLGLSANEGIQRVHTAGLCPVPELGDTIGSPRFSVVAAVIPPPDDRIAAGSEVGLRPGECVTAEG